MRTLEFTTPDGTTWTATPADVGRAAESLLMDGTMVLSAEEVEALRGRERERHALDVALIRAVVERAVERGIAKQ